MRRLVLGFLALLLGPLVAVTAGGLLAAPALAATGTVTGVATIGGSAVPAGNEVELLRWNEPTSEWFRGYGGNGPEDGFTRADGSFEFTGLAAGTWSVGLHGHVAPGSTSLPAGPGAPGTVTITDGGTGAIDLPLPAAPLSVTGRILTLTGEPAVGALVELGLHSTTDHPSKLFTASTDGAGHYTLPVFDAVADHTITAWLEGYQRTLLGDTQLFWEAESFSFAGAGGPQRSLDDLTLQTQRIGGQVRDVAGAPAAGREVRLLKWRQAQAQWDVLATTLTTATGRYVFLATGTGHFTVALADPRGNVFPTTGFVSPTPGLAVDMMGGPGHVWASSSATIDDLDVALPPAPVGTVTVRGLREPGARLSARTDAWRTGYQLGHQWLRDGAAITGATGSSYRLTKRDAGRQISVHVTPTSTFPGLDTEPVTSPVVRIKRATALGLSVTGQRGRVAVAVRLTMSGVTAARTTGRVALYVDGRLRVRLTLRRGAAGVTVRRLRAGRHTVEVRFAATSTHGSARTSRTVRVR